MEFIFGCNIKVVQCSGKVRNLTILMLVITEISGMNDFLRGLFAKFRNLVFHEICVS